jgi:hypothetical protein
MPESAVKPQPFIKEEQLHLGIKWALTILSDCFKVSMWTGTTSYNAETGEM